VSWSGLSCSIAVRYLGLQVSGDARVDPHGVHIEAVDPGFLLRKRAADYLRRRFERYLDPATPLAELPRK